MAEFAALPLFTDALLADCSHLDDCELGLYMRILILMWRSPNCKIPNDPQWISRKLKRDFSLIEPLIKEFISSDGNYWFQKRLLKEFEYTRIKRKKNTEAAKSLWKNKKQQSERYASKTTSGIAPSPSPSPSKEKVVTNVTTKKKVSIEELSISHIQDWLTGKRISGKYLTVDENAQLEYFKDYCRAKNPKYTDYIAAFRNSFNWENVQTKGNGNEGHTHRRNGTNPTKADRIKAAGDRALARLGILPEGETDQGNDQPMFRQLEYIREGT